MNTLLRPIACVALAIALGAGIGSTIGWQSASAVTVEDSTGNPDVTAPLVDPDDGSADGSSSQSGGFSIIAPDQNGNTSLPWTFGSPMTTDGSSDGQTQ